MDNTSSWSTWDPPILTQLTYLLWQEKVSPCPADQPTERGGMYIRQRRKVQQLSKACHAFRASQVKLKGKEEKKKTNTKVRVEEIARSALSLSFFFLFFFVFLLWVQYSTLSSQPSASRLFRFRRWEPPGVDVNSVGGFTIRLRQWCITYLPSIYSI